MIGAVRLLQIDSNDRLPEMSRSRGPRWTRTQQTGEVTGGGMIQGLESGFAQLLLLDDYSIETGTQRRGIFLVVILDPPTETISSSSSSSEKQLLRVTGCLRGGSQILARPLAPSSNLPPRLMFISSTMTRRKSLFSRGSRCLDGMGACPDMARPASERASGVPVLELRRERRGEDEARLL